MPSTRKRSHKVRYGSDGPKSDGHLERAALLAALGLVPAEMSHAIGSETQQPIAVVVVGGTLTAAALTLIALPVSMLLVLRAQKRFAKVAELEAVPVVG